MMGWPFPVTWEAKPTRGLNSLLSSCGRQAVWVRFHDRIEAGLEAVAALGDGNVILELPFLLNRLLRNVCVRSKGDVSGKGERRYLLFRVDQVVPILVAGGQGVDHSRRQNRVQRGIADDEMVSGEVARRQIVRAAGLVVVPSVVLRAIADKQVVPVIKVVVVAPRITPVKVQGRNRGGRGRSHQGIIGILDDGQLVEGG